MPRASDPDLDLFTPGDPELIFTELKEIGHGSFGNVYFARQVDNDDIVAVKKMAYSGKNSQEKLQDIQKEIEFLKQCCHPNCIQFKGCYLKGHTVWLSMEYCLGSAADIIEVHKSPLAEPEIAAMIKDTLTALDYIHANSMIHRDVKAGNILIAANGRVKLADFGSASLRSPANSFVGTPYWMAPEVILAMDEGTYDDRVDIWSLGITCIELSEGKPPLFNMNAMAALYHIAQNESPRLGEGGNAQSTWSTCYKDFIARCLVKEASDRPRACDLLKHTLMVEAHPETVLSMLVARTKDAVRRLDNKSYRAARKIFMLNNHNGDTSDVRTDEDNDSMSTGSAGSLQDPDSMEFESEGEENGMMGDNEHNEYERRNSVVEVSNAEVDDEEISFSIVNPPVPEIEINRDNFRPTHEGFSTIKPNATLSKQMMQNNPENEIKNQMMVYKQMRQHNVKQLKQLEQRHRYAVEELRRSLERDLETLRSSNEREHDKFKLKLRDDKLAHDREVNQQEKKFVKTLNEKYETTQKFRIGETKKLYLQKKELLRREMSQTPKQCRKSSIDVSKDKIKRELTENEERYLNTVQKENEQELRNHRGSCLKVTHALENDSFQEEWNLKEIHKNSLAHMKRKHHHDMCALQEQHQSEIHAMRQKQLQDQHAAEWENQMEYTQRVQKELRRKHALQNKQQPKNLRRKKQQIHKQFEATCKIIESQYKELLKDYLRNSPKELHKDIIKKFKDDKMQKMISLNDQYTKSIADHLEREQVNLDESQTAEQEEVRATLHKEQELLQAYQRRLHHRLQESMSNEKELFVDESHQKLALLQEDLIEVDHQFARARTEAESKERVRQRKELTDFQNQSHELPPSDTFMNRTWGRRSSPFAGFSKF
ncbi:serine/threonine-protein kinase TAO1-like [Bolinopsis microptera]|uniref:serine/threonine-protein kinase TAO1-like n=1 Tax=Bolinopsis microptera TaxID=2820187 RepID=UPI003079001E